MTFGSSLDADAFASEAQAGDVLASGLQKDFAEASEQVLFKAIMCNFLLGYVQTTTYSD